jgi:hypothetical protein
VLVGGLLPLLILTAALVPPIALSSRLPEPIATHWSFDGRPNDSTPQAFFFAMMALTQLGLS